MVMPARSAASRHRLPDDLLCNGHICPPALHRTWEQIGLGLHPAPVLAQSLQQLRGQQHVAITATLALTHMNDHALAVDIGDLEVAHLGPAQAGCIQHHHHGAMHQVTGRIDQPRYLLLVEYGRKPPLTLGKWNVIGKVWPPSVLTKRKRRAQVRSSDGPRGKLAIAKQMKPDTAGYDPGPNDTASDGSTSRKSSTAWR